MVSWVLLWNEMHCEIMTALRVSKTQRHLIFFWNTTCWNVQTETSSKLTEYSLQRNARLTRHLQCLLQLRSQKHGSFRNRGKKGTNGSTLMKKNTKTIGTKNFQTDSLKAHKASEGHATSLAAKRAGKWETKGGKTLACCWADLMKTHSRKWKEFVEIHLCCYVSLKKFQLYGCN